MVNLENSPLLHRKIRKDECPELGIPTWRLVAEAIKSGRSAEALELLEYARGESERNNISLASFIEQVMTRLAGLDEEEVMKVVHDRYFESTREWMEAAPTAKDAMQRSVEAQRGHHAEFTVTEEADRYVVRYDTCGTGGRLKRMKSLGFTKKAYPWSWGKAGVPYYCTHCAIHWEIIPIELRGYPIRINLPGEKPSDPCMHLFYKDPKNIPEEYFRRVGKTKTIK